VYITNAREETNRIFLSQIILGMSIGITEKRVSYDNPCAPIVQFSHSNNSDEFDEEDMTDDQTSSAITMFNPSIG
jgi:hypothetical protein